MSRLLMRLLCLIIVPLWLVAGDVPGPEAEVRAIRELKAAGNPAALANLLDSAIIDIPAGSFLMGSDTGSEHERPRRLVYLDAFRIGRYEITQVQYRRFVLATGKGAPPYWRGNRYLPGTDDHPVVGVTWEDAAAYCAWAGGRLPTEAEWEKAARGTDGRTYPWGETWDPGRANVDTQFDPGFDSHLTDKSKKTLEYAWTLLGEASTHPCLQPVGSFPLGSSPYGLMDTMGNASEWVADWYNWGNYRDLPDRNPRVTGPAWNHCLRGSAWFYPYGMAGRAAFMSRCAMRNSSHATRDPRVGFRCAFDGR